MEQRSKDMTDLDRIARQYVRCVLATGVHDADYVDAYFGEESVRSEVAAEKASLQAIRDRAAGAVAELGEPRWSSLLGIEALRCQYLRQQFRSMMARIDILDGKKLTFDEEAHALYDAAPPVHTAEHFKSILKELDAVLPGPGPVAPRYDSFKKQFIIPRERLDAVFTAAITECRRRTLEHIPCPAGENFVVEYVNNKPWSGYNWFKGNAYSLIQVNTDLPIYIDRAVDLAAHEGYPGHHVYNSLLESNLFRARNWTEFSVYALFSPQSLIAEGTANYGIDVVLPGHERIDFESSVLFPLAGCDPGQTGLYYRIHALFNKLAYAGNEAARGYLNGVFSREEAAQWLVDYALMSPERALQRTKFFDAYRSYVINYNLGQDLVGAYIERRGGTAANPQKRWKEFAELISSPRLPSGLA
jgi:hypothetical protein